MTRRLIHVAYSPPVFKRHETGPIEMWSSPLYVYLYDDGTAIQYSEGTWGRLPVPPADIFGDIPQDAPAEPDPIAELEAMGGQLHVDTIAGLLTWHSDGARELVGRTARLDGIRAAAARLLARVKGDSK